MHARRNPASLHRAAESSGIPTAQITQLGRSDATQVTAVLLGQNGGLVCSRLLGFTTVRDRLAR